MQECHKYRHENGLPIASAGRFAGARVMFGIHKVLGHIVSLQNSPKSRILPRNRTKDPE